MEWGGGGGVVIIIVLVSTIKSLLTGATPYFLLYRSKLTGEISNNNLRN